MEELKADVVATSDPEVINTCLQVSLIDESVKGILGGESMDETKKKDSEGNEEPLMKTSSEMLDNQRVEISSNDYLEENLSSSNSSPAGDDESSTEDMMSRDRESSVISRDSSIMSRDDSVMSRNGSVMSRGSCSSRDGCDDEEAMDCTTSPCSDHSDEESE